MMLDDKLETVIDADGVDALRAGCWTLLGHLMMAPPAAEMLQRLDAIEAPGGESADSLATAWARLRKAAHETSGEALQAEFHDVFIGVGGGEVTPYASWYLAGSLVDRPLVQLRQDLEALGVSRSAACSEPEDHAGAVCETMAFAILDEDVDFDWQRELFLRHVDGWMGRFFEDLEHAPSADFYRAVGALGKAFFELERRFYAMSA